MLSDLVQNRRKRWMRTVDAVNWIYEDTWMADDVIEVPASVINTYLPLPDGRPIWGVGDGETNATIKPYSTAVAPDSSRRKLVTCDMSGGPLYCEESSPPVGAVAILLYGYYALTF